MMPDDYWKTTLLIIAALTIAHSIALYQLIGN